MKYKRYQTRTAQIENNLFLDEKLALMYKRSEKFAPPSHRNFLPLISYYPLNPNQEGQEKSFVHQKS